MPNNGAALAPGFLETLAGAGFTHLFLLVDTVLEDAKNQKSAGIQWNYADAISLQVCTSYTYALQHRRQS